MSFEFDMLLSVPARSGNVLRYFSIGEQPVIFRGNDVYVSGMFVFSNENFRKCHIRIGDAGVFLFYILPAKTGKTNESFLI